MSSFGKRNVEQHRDLSHGGEILRPTVRAARKPGPGVGSRGALWTAAAVSIAAEAAFGAFLLLAPHHLAALDPGLPQGVSALPFVTSASSQWHAFRTTDSLFGDVTQHVTLFSRAAAPDNSDPYLQDTTQGTLELSSNPNDGRFVTVSFPKVKTSCQTHHCHLRASFDQTEPQSFAYIDMSTDHATVLKVANYDRFTQRLAVTHDLTLVASLGTKRASVLRFTVTGYGTAWEGGHSHLVIKLAALPPLAGQPYPG